MFSPTSSAVRVVGQLGGGLDDGAEVLQAAVVRGEPAGGGPGGGQGGHGGVLPERCEPPEPDGSATGEQPCSSVNGSVRLGACRIRIPFARSPARRGCPRRPWTASSITAEGCGRAPWTRCIARSPTCTGSAPSCG